MRARRLWIWALATLLFAIACSSSAEKSAPTEARGATADAPRAGLVEAPRESPTLSPKLALGPGEVSAHRDASKAHQISLPKELRVEARSGSSGLSPQAIACLVLQFSDEDLRRSRGLAVELGADKPWQARALELRADAELPALLEAARSTKADALLIVRSDERFDWWLWELAESRLIASRAQPPDSGSPLIPLVKQLERLFGD